MAKMLTLIVMKILYLITKSNWGGAQRNVFDLATTMKERDHEVVVALGGDGILRQKLEGVGVYTHSIGSMNRDVSVGKDTLSFKEILSVIRHRKPDILHLHSPKAAGLGALAGRLLRVKKIIYTVHGWPFNENRSIMQKISIVFFSWITIMLSHKVIVLSQREYDQALHFPYAKKRLVLIPLGIKPPVFLSVDGAKQTMSKMLGMPLADFNKRTIIGTIAELHPNKGLYYLIDAYSIVAKEYPNILGIIIGSGQDEQIIRAKITEKGLENNVRLIGYLDQAAEYLKTFSVFTLSSIKEGLPYVILEAGFASLPVVSTTVGGIPEVIEDMKSGILVQPKNSRELAHAFSFMIENPAERRKYGAALRERILREFSFEKMVEKMANLYSGHSQ